MFLLNRPSISGLLAIIALLFFSEANFALDVPSTTIALRLRNGITGGTMPVTDPLFTKMVTQVAAGDIYGAAQTAASSKYFANYFARRLALQMQTPSLDTTGIKDSDATAFLIAHFVGAQGVAPRLSTIWAESATYLVVNPDNQELVHAASLNTN